MLDAHPASDVPPPTPELSAKAIAAGWPTDLLERVLSVRPDLGMIEAWIDYGYPQPDQVERWLAEQLLVRDTALHVRAATWADHELLADLCAHAPEQVGDWTVTVERSPNPFAQYRLQEHGNVLVIEDKRVGLAMSASSVRNTYIQGQRTSVNLMSGWRVRDGFRGLGFSQMLQMGPGSGTSWFGLVSYWFVRLHNASADWITKIETEMSDRPSDISLETTNLTASIVHIPAQRADGESQGRRSVRSRPARREDLSVCVELINRTHGGLDLFRPYTLDYLGQRLDDPNWGPKPSFYPEIYGWPDYQVIELDGEIVACGGMWDRGRDVREIWVRDERRVVHDPTALMDFGYAAHHESAMAELIGDMVAQSGELGRAGLLAPLEFLSELQAELADLEYNVDVRELHAMPFTEPDLKVELMVQRPYTDLAYW